jgi:hypothetical protein
MDGRARQANQVFPPTYVHYESKPNIPASPRSDGRPGDSRPSPVVMARFRLESDAQMRTYTIGT